jgi:hypothetical protein
MPRPVISAVNVSVSVPSASYTWTVVPLYQTASISMRPSVPRIEARLGPFVSDAEMVVATRAPSYPKIVAMVASAPVSLNVACDCTVSGSPNRSQANETG